MCTSPFSGPEKLLQPARSRCPRRQTLQGNGEEEGRETFISSLTVMFIPGLQKLIQWPPWGNLGKLKASFIVPNSWIEIKGHKGLEGMDENWV